MALFGWVKHLVVLSEHLAMAVSRPNGQSTALTTGVEVMVSYAQRGPHQLGFCFGGQYYGYRLELLGRLLSLYYHLLCSLSLLFTGDREVFTFQFLAPVLVFTELSTKFQRRDVLRVFTVLVMFLV
jgi:hypothetical protein